MRRRKGSGRLVAVRLDVDEMECMTRIMKDNPFWGLSGILRNALQLYFDKMRATPLLAPFDPVEEQIRKECEQLDPVVVQELLETKSKDIFARTRGIHEVPSIPPFNGKPKPRKRANAKTVKPAKRKGVKR